MSEKIPVTQEGFQELQNEINHLIHVERPQVIEDLKDARAQGDLSENADYDAARDRQARVEARIRELENIISNVVIISEGDKKGKARTVKLGSTVTILDLEMNQEFTYSIVGSVEADPINGKLSNVSPLAAAIIDHKVNEEVEVNVDNPYLVRIITIK